MSSRVGTLTGGSTLVLLAIAVGWGASLASATRAQTAPPDQDTTRSPRSDSEIAPLREEVARLRRLVPSQSHAMQDVSYHYTNLWFAGQKANWPLAQFYLNETRSHISWAVRIIPKRLSELPARKEIVAYCRGPYFLKSYHAVEKLRAKGRRTRRLVEGLPSRAPRDSPWRPGPTSRPRSVPCCGRAGPSASAAPASTPEGSPMASSWKVRAEARWTS
jgi:hypothetical protein